MSVSRLPSGRWRGQVYNPVTGRVESAAAVLGLRARSFSSERDAKDAVTHARDKLRGVRRGAGDWTVEAWFERWSSDPRFRRRKASSDLTYRSAVRGFVDRYGPVLLADVDDEIVDEWLRAGNGWTVNGLRVMFGDAMRKPLRLVSANPFAKLALPSSPGRRDQRPPSEDQAAGLLGAARRLCPPGFAAWLQIAMFTGCRGGEVDALRWECVHSDRGRIHVRAHYSPISGEFTRPKNGRDRWVPILPPVAEALEMARAEGRGSEFVCVNTRGNHWTRYSRQFHWQRCRDAVGFDGDLYLATRHFAGWYLYERRRYSAEDVAVMLGHRDGGELIRRLYGHHDADAALERILLGERDAGFGGLKVA